MIRKLAALVICLSTSTMAQEDLIPGTDIRMVDWMAGIETLATQDVGEIPQLLLEGYLALVDPDFFEAPLSLSPIAQVLTLQFLAREASLERSALQIALTRALDDNVPHQTVLAAYLDRIYLGQSCNGIFWGSQHSFGHPLPETTIAEQVLLLTHLLSHHTNADRTEAGFTWTIEDLRVDETRQLAFEAVTALLIDKGLLTPAQAESVAREVGDLPQISCPITLEEGRHPNDLPRPGLARFATRDFRTEFPLSDMTYTALVNRLGTEPSTLFSDESPMAAAFVGEVWPRVARLSDIYDTPDEMAQDWRQIWGSPFEIAPMLIETLPMGLGCTGPTALIRANWGVAPTELSLNEQAVIAALIATTDPEALVTDRAALEAARNAILEQEHGFDRIDAEALAFHSTAPLPPLLRRCSE